MGSFRKMGITRSSQHKRRNTGGKKTIPFKKRKHALGRPMAGTRIGIKRIRTVRARGGATKYRALRPDHGNFSWGSEVCTRKTRVLDVVYNASNNELVRTKTLVKNAVVQVDATPFRQWYEAHYGIEISKKKTKKAEKEAADKAADGEVKKSNHVKRKIEARQKTRVLENPIQEQLAAGRMYACISSRPGQSGRCDGYLLEGKELDCYVRKLSKKRSAK